MIPHHGLLGLFFDYMFHLSALILEQFVKLAHANERDNSREKLLPPNKFPLRGGFIMKRTPLLLQQTFGGVFIGPLSSSLLIRTTTTRSQSVSQRDPPAAKTRDNATQFNFHFNKSIN